MCPTLSAVLEIERDEWYGNIRKSQPGDMWRKAATRIHKMVGADRNLALLLKEDLPRG